MNFFPNLNLGRSLKKDWTCSNELCKLRVWARITAFPQNQKFKSIREIINGDYKRISFRSVNFFFPCMKKLHLPCTCQFLHHFWLISFTFLFYPWFSWKSIWYLTKLITVLAPLQINYQLTIQNVIVTVTLLGYFGMAQQFFVISLATLNILVLTKYTTIFISRVFDL